MLPKIEAKPARELTSGAWTARWGDWLIEMRHQPTGWRVRVYTWTQGRRDALLRKAVITNTEEAVRWACDVLARQGAQVIINGNHRPIIDYLAFTPAPALVLEV